MARKKIDVPAEDIAEEGPQIPTPAPVVDTHQLPDPADIPVVEDGEGVEPATDTATETPTRTRKPRADKGARRGRKPKVDAEAERLEAERAIMEERNARAAMVGGWAGTAISGTVDVLGKTLARRYGNHWQFTPEECLTLGKVWGEVAGLYLTDIKDPRIIAVVAASLSTLAIVGARLGAGVEIAIPG